MSLLQSVSKSRNLASLLYLHQIAQPSNIVYPQQRGTRNKEPQRWLPSTPTTTPSSVSPLLPLQSPPQAALAVLTSPPGQLKDVIQILYETMIQVANYDAHTAAPATTTTNGNSTPSRGGGPAPTPSSATSPPTREVLANQLAQLSAALQGVDHLAVRAALSGLPADIPRELITYVDGGRNPDIYTREFVELVRRENQLMRGKMRAFASFRDVLAREIASANPELRDDVAAVVVGTGGSWPLQAESGAQ